MTNFSQTTVLTLVITTNKQMLSNQYGVLYHVTLLVSTELAKDFLADYSHVTIGSADLVANHDITQIIEVCPQDDKPTM